MRIYYFVELVKRQMWYSRK